MDDGCIPSTLRDADRSLVVRVVESDGQFIADVHHHPVQQAKPDKSWPLNSSESFGGDLRGEERNHQDWILDADVLALVRHALVIVNIGLNTTQGSRADL